LRGKSSVIARSELGLTALLLAQACACPSGPVGGSAFTARPWPEADVLFHQDPHWLGADDAYSVDLSGGRVLWLFGDTFVATSDAGLRSQSVMVHNTVAIQTGYDPSQARIAFCWESTDAGPGAYFGGDDGGEWYWPGHGVMVGGQLVVFLSRIASSSGGLGFQAAGWTAVRIDDPQDEPTLWRPTYLATPTETLGVTFGETVVDWDGGLWVFGAEDQSYAVHVIRWPDSAVAAGDLSSPEWWTPSGWVPYASLSASPAPLFSDGATELRVQPDPHSAGWIEVQTAGFGAATLDVRTSPSLTGPWGSLSAVYMPPEATRSGILIYAGKSHPELLGASVVATYATNDSAFATLVADQTLYFPRFVRMDPDGG
jgi:hypothetical protein